MSINWRKVNMKIKKTEAIKALLDYQDKVNSLFLEKTGVETIPDSVRITSEELDDSELLCAIVENFEPRTRLDWLNTLHCLVYGYKEMTNQLEGDSDGCSVCKYYTILGAKCNSHKSLLYKVATDDFDELYKLGVELMGNLKKYCSIN